MNKHYFYYFVHEKKGFGCGTCSCASPLFPLSEITRGIRKKGDSSAIISFWKEISREEYEKINETMNEANNERDRLPPTGDRPLQGAEQELSKDDIQIEK